VAAGSRNKKKALSFRTGPARAVVHLRKGEEALRERSLAAAFRSYEATLDEDPGNAYAWENKGIVLETHGRGPEVLKADNRATVPRPKFVRAYVNTAVASSERAPKVGPSYALRAVGCVEKAQALSPRFATACVPPEQAQGAG